MTRNSLRIPLSVIGAAFGGVLLAAAYAPLNLWILAPVGLAIIIAIQWGSSVRLGFFTGLIFGFVSFFAQHFWLGVVGTDAHLILSVYLALWIAIIGAGSSYVSRRLPPLLAIFAIAGLWVTEEALRGRYPFGGYPWARVVFSQADSPLSHWSTIAGVPFVTAVVVLIAAAIAMVLRKSSVRNLTISLVVVALAGGVPLFISSSTNSNSQIVISVIQGGTPQIGMGAMDVRRAVLDNHVDETLILAEKVKSGEEPQPDLVLWPENSSDINPYLDDSAYQAITSAAQAIRVPILVGAVVDSFENPETEVYNMGILWDPITGPGETYIKNAPVPFGEFIPFRSVLTKFISRYDRVPRDFAHGKEPGIFTVNGVTLGDLICFEVAVDRVVNRVVSDGAGVLLVQTNNATYANSALPVQQLNIERIRAIEMGQSVVVAATTGISAAIDENGNVISQLTDGEVGSFTYTAPVSNNRTLGSFTGPWLELFIVVVTVFSLTLVAFSGRKHRQG